jgi:hypothetical protein
MNGKRDPYNKSLLNVKLTAQFNEHTFTMNKTGTFARLVIELIHNSDILSDMSYPILLLLLTSTLAKSSSNYIKPKFSFSHF